MDTNERLKEIRQRAEAATQERWLLFAQGSVIEIQTTDRSRPIVAWTGFDNCLRDLEEHIANARFMVAAHQDIPYLLDEIERLRGVLSEYAAIGNWSPLDEHGMNPSEWLPEQEGWLRAAKALKDSE